MIQLELVTQQNLEAIREIQRDDIPHGWVDDADTVIALTQYELTHLCIGHTYIIKYENRRIGVILLGEAIPWETDPKEMNGTPFYRLMDFVMDRRYRGKGIGGKALELVIRTVYAEYGTRPIALGVHRNNRGAATFYERHGFYKTDATEGNDIYYIRYPNPTSKNNK